MSIQGTDQRTEVTDFTAKGINGIVAVDSLETTPTETAKVSPGVGSGILLASNFVLTAGHVVTTGSNLDAAGRVTAGKDVSALPKRVTTDLGPTDVNYTSANVSLPDDYLNNRNFAHDIALIQTSSTIDATPQGMALYLDSRDLLGKAITSAGFPGKVVNNSGSINDGTVDPGVTLSNATVTHAVKAFQGSGTVATVKPEGRFFYSDTLDTEAGQSGSGVWTMLDRGDGTMEAAVIGVHTQGGQANGGHLITENEYRNITATMEAAKVDASKLPISHIIGTEVRFGPDQPGELPFARSGEDIIQGSFLRENIKGMDQNDFIEGRGGDDSIDGGENVDTAGYKGQLTEYEIKILDGTDFSNPKVSIEHTGGDMKDGKDTLMNTEFAVFRYTDAQKRGEQGFGQDDDGQQFFVPLLADVDDLTKLRDGADVNASQKIVDADGNDAGTFRVSHAAFSFDGDLDFRISLATEESALFNFVYIVDSSGSMSGTRIAQTKAAYEALTNNLIQTGVADRSQFAVVDFDSSARLFDNLDAQGAISAVNGLRAGGGTRFGPALDQAETWFESLSNVGTAKNIAFFLSDGRGSGASAALQEVNEGVMAVPVDVRAFGIGSGARLDDLNLIDSNTAVQLSDASQLIDAFGTSGFEENRVDRVEVKLDGQLVQTIAGSQFTDTALSLDFAGSLDNIPIGLGASATSRFEVFFTDNAPSQVIEIQISDGQSEVRQQSMDGNREVVVLSVVQQDYIIQGMAESVSGNVLNNKFTAAAGDHDIKAGAGNDTFELAPGVKGIFNGQEGIDTAVFTQNRADVGNLSSNGSVVSVGEDITLLNVEFIQFADQRVETGNLTAVPTLSIDNTSVTVGEAGGSAVFNFNLSEATTTDVTFRVATVDGTATAGSDYNAVMEVGLITAGTTPTAVNTVILNDENFEGTETFTFEITDLQGAVFADGSTSATLSVAIEDDEPDPNVASLTGNTFTGTADQDQKFFFTGNNTMNGGGSSDFLVGGMQSDTVNGEEGNDLLAGDASSLFGASDLIRGGTGNDIQMGGAGADTFAFNINDGNDLIAAFDPTNVGFTPLDGYSAAASGADFQAGVDKIRLEGFSTVDASNVMGSVSDGTDGAVFSAEGTMITFFGVTAADLSASDFTFV